MSHRSRVRCNLVEGPAPGKAGEGREASLWRTWSGGLGDHKHPTSKTGSFSSLEILFANTTDMQDKYCGNCYDIYLIQSKYTKVGPFGRATSFVVAFVEAVNIVNVVAVKTVARDFWGRADSKFS